ncbi:MAG TPA: DUF2339 domain-containing protein [Chthoniobacterales bacterium]|nr:DUF2339 domain-containing protein [Chthoniobacterales bacterium]
MITRRVAILETQRSPVTVPGDAYTPPVAAAPIVPPAVAPGIGMHAVPPPLPMGEVAAPPASPTMSPPPISRAAPSKPARAAIDWEAFMGVKLFAWLGGFVLFLGVVFLVKYSFENNLITPVMRVVIGAAIGLTLVAAGWLTARRDYRVPGQSLCATGVLVLYADIFGAHAFYGLISLTSAFVLMSAVTLVAFVLAVRLEAQVVVVLGLVGGFLTPPLLTSGPDNPILLFGYVALLNAGIAAVALRKKWDYLLLLAAIGTVLTEVAWLPLNDAGRATIGFLIFLGLQAQFLAFAYLRQRETAGEKWSASAAGATGFASLGFALWLLSYSALASRAGFFFGFAFLADIGLLALAMLRPNPARLAAAAGAAMFLILSLWTGWYLNDALLWSALGAYLLFALVHAGFTVWPPRTAAEARGGSWPSYIPLLALVLLFLCVWHGQTSFAVWACVLAVDLIALALAWASASLLALVVTLLATIITTGLWILTAPPLTGSVSGMLAAVGGFGIFFSTASSVLTRRLGLGNADSRRNVPALAAAMPFLLLLMLIAKLPVADPTAIFAVTLLLAVLLLGLGLLARTSWIGAVALAFTWAVEREWHALHFTNTHALLALGWYVAFFLIFTAYPFFVAEERAALPWAIGAMSGVLHFWLIFELISAAWPSLRNGLLPALFILPYGFGLLHLIKKRGIAPASGDARLAWQGGAALFFLSLVFPIQFDREWITLGWALEGFALLMLFRSVPNAGLRLVGTGLLGIAFVRLAFNPAVFEYHPRSSTRIWNWYLYAYGITCLCLFGGARAVQRDRQTQLERIIPRCLYVCAAILTFLLLNIEIADYFSVGPTLTFSFEGNFARDMSYSIAWALFAFALLLIGMRQKTKWIRYAGVALLLVTLAKLFLHDFASLGPLYRIGAFIGVALILIIASFVYQRFLAPARPGAEH